MQLNVPEPVSGGIILSYKCTSGCRHCMYACSPRWSADWMDVKTLEEVLYQLRGKIQPGLSINSGLHFTGGEPFLNFDLLLKAVEMAHEIGIPSIFAETSCYWCEDEQTTQERFAQLKEAGMEGMLISVNPFILENVPFEKTERAVEVAKGVFEDNTMIYQQFYYQLFKQLKVTGTMPFEVLEESIRYAEMIPMGRAPYKLNYLFQQYPPDQFFGHNCEEELRRQWHTHVDNYCNYIPAYCGGISLGDARDLNSILNLDLKDKPVLKALATDIKELYDLGVEYGYQPLDGYVSKCHLCVDLRKHLVDKDDFQELKPEEFYRHLE